VDELLEEEVAVEDGTCKKWYPDGTLKHCKLFKDGVLEGRSKSYYPNGVIRRNCRFLHHSPYRDDTRYYENGSRKITTEWSKHQTRKRVRTFREAGGIESCKEYHRFEDYVNCETEFRDGGFSKKRVILRDSGYSCGTQPSDGFDIEVHFSKAGDLEKVDVTRLISPSSVSSDDDDNISLTTLVY
jgi:hypothetical protein